MFVEKGRKNRDARRAFVFEYRSVGVGGCAWTSEGVDESGLSIHGMYTTESVGSSCCQIYSTWVRRLAQNDMIQHA